MSFLRRLLPALHAALLTFGLTFNVTTSASADSPCPRSAPCQSTDSAQIDGASSIMLAVSFAVPLGFGIADLVSFSGRRPFDHVAVAFEIGAATFSTVMAATTFFLATTHRQAAAGLAAVGATHLAFAALHVAHVVWSLTSRRPPPLALSLVPLGDGAFVQAVGRF